MKNPIIRRTVFLSLVIVALTFAISLAVPFDDSPEPGKARQFTRKSGDLTVFWYGHAATPHGRMGSVGNRAFQGGGLHGGK